MTTEVEENERSLCYLFFSSFMFTHFNIVQLLAIAVIGFGVWMSTHHDGCRKSLTLPVLGLGAVIFVM